MNESELLAQSDNKYTIIESSSSNFTGIKNLVVGNYRVDIDFRFGTYNEIFGNSTTAFNGNAKKILAIAEAVTELGSQNIGPYDPILRATPGLEKFEDASTGEVFAAAYFPVEVTDKGGIFQRRTYGNYGRGRDPLTPFIWMPRGANEKASPNEELMYGIISNVVNIPVDVSINNVNVIEAKKSVAIFTVSLSNAPGLGESVTVNYTTSDGSAGYSSDYSAKSGTLTFKAGEATKNIQIGIKNNNQIEPDENFKVILSQPSFNANIVDAEGIATISDNDSLSSSTTTVLADANKNANLITGNANNNTLSGGKGNDTILGQDGNEILLGMAGNDTLTGGKGSDSFAYASGQAYNISDIGKDTITDFTNKDQIVLSKTTFTALASELGNGFSIGNEFAVVDNSAEVGSSIAKIVFNSANQTLYYNANGSNNGLGIGSAFAVLTGVDTLSASDFVIGEVA